MTFHQFSITYIFLALVNARSDLRLSGEGFIFAGVDLILS